MPPLPLNLTSLTDLDCGLTKSFLECLCDAASVCLAEEFHASGVRLRVSSWAEHEYAVSWNQVDAEMRRTWADPDFATENGACCVALLLVHDLMDMVAIERSAKNNGFDYWIGRRETVPNLFQRLARLEVTGLRHATASAIANRLEAKVSRLRRYHESLAAFVVVVEFGAPRARIVEMYGNRE